MENTPAGWYTDPWSSRRIRYWNGQEWTIRTTREQTVSPGHETAWTAGALLLVAAGFVALVVQPFVLR